jgi:type II secretory pathway pseudopilin PulG
MMSIIKNHKGFGILESIIAMALFGAGIYIVLNGIDVISSSKDKASEKMDLEKIISSSFEQIRSSIQSEKIDFKASENFLSKSTYSEVQESLVLRWNKNGITTIDGCSTCKGRMGYVVTPYQIGNLTFRGMYKVTLRVTHEVLFPNEFREYQFIVKGL